MRYYNFGDEPAIVPDDFFMKEAFKEAKLAFSEDEIPIGAVVVCGDSLDVCFEEAKEIAEQVKGTKLEVSISSMDGLKKNLEQFKEWGIRF